MRGAPEVDVEHPDVARSATKALAVSDADTIDVGVDCGVLRRGYMPQATSRQKKNQGGRNRGDGKGRRVTRRY